MILYSDSNSIDSHQVRIALAEKGMFINVDYIGQGCPLPSAITDVVDNAKLPILVDRDITIYDTNIILEYLDERFPHPPLLPINPIARARYRLVMHEIAQQWISLVDQLLAAETEQAKKKTRQKLQTSLLASTELFTPNQYLLGNEFSLVDCYLLPLLWRLDRLEIKFPASNNTKMIRNYMERMFKRKSFRESLSEEEKDFETC